jgi:hypothetical protein
MPAEIAANPSGDSMKISQMVQINLGSADLIKAALEEGAKEAVVKLTDIGKAAFRGLMDEPACEESDLRTLAESESILTKATSFLKFFDSLGLISTDCNHVKEILDSKIVGDANLEAVLFPQEAVAEGDLSQGKAKPKKASKKTEVEVEVE